MSLPNTSANTFLPAQRQNSPVTHLLCAAICRVDGTQLLTTGPQANLPHPDSGIQEVTVAKDQIDAILDFCVQISSSVHHHCGSVVQECGHVASLRQWHHYTAF